MSGCSGSLTLPGPGPRHVFSVQLGQRPSAPGIRGLAGGGVHCFTSKEVWGGLLERGRSIMIGVNSRHGCRLSGLSVCLSVLSEKELVSPSDTSFVEKSKFQSHVHPFVFTSSVKGHCGHMLEHWKVPLDCPSAMACVVKYMQKVLSPGTVRPGRIRLFSEKQRALLN